MKGKLHHKHGVFGSVPLLLLQDDRITEKALRVWIALSSFEGTKAGSYPGIEEIGKRAGVARSSVSAATRLLVTAGWLQKKRRGLGKSNVYETLSYSAPMKEFQAEKRKRRQPREESGRFSDFRDSRKSRSPSSTEDQSSVSHGTDEKTTVKDHREKAPAPSVPPIRGPRASSRRNTGLLDAASAPFVASSELGEDVGALDPAREAAG